MVRHPAVLSKGQSLVEYSLGIALVSLISMGGIMALSHSLNAQFSNMLLGDSSLASEPSAPASSASPPVENVQLATLPTPPAQSGQSSGASTGAPAASQPKANPLQVTGSNGMQSTDAYASVLSQIADTVTNDPNMDPALKNLITKLANSGHTLADAEATASSNLINGAIGVNLESGNFNSLSSQLTAYLAAHPDALPPQVASELTGASGWISNHIQELNTDAGWSQVLLGGGSKTTNQKANTICANGGNAAQCVK